MAFTYACSYGKLREVKPKSTECVICNRNIMTKDIKGHWASKAHKANVEQQEALKKAPKKVGTFSEENSFHNSIAGGNDSWEASVATTPADGAGFEKPTQADNNAAVEDGEWSKAGPPRIRARSGTVVAKGRGNGNGCFNCGEEGHRANECSKGDIRLCFNCNMPGHTKTECLQSANPRAPDTATCFNCHEIGHRKADCPNARVFLCNNCEKTGHVARDCPEPKNWDKVVCNNCKMRGHTAKRCPEPSQEPEIISGDWELVDNGEDAGGFAGEDAGDTGDWSTGW